MFNIPASKLKELLLKDGLLTAEQFDQVAQDAVEAGKSVVEALLSRNLITRDYFEELFSRYFGVPLVRLDTANIDPGIFALLPEETARQRRGVPFKKNPDGSIDAATEDRSEEHTSE